MSLTPNLLLVTLILFKSYFSVFCKDGDVCELKDGSRGTCMKLSKCPYAYKDVIRFNFPKVCSFHLWNPSVCCLDCSNVTKLELDVSAGLYWRWSQADWRCGVIAPCTKYSFHYLIDGYNEANEKCLEQLYKSFPCKELGGEFEALDESIMCDSNPLEDLTYVSPIIAGGKDAAKAEFPHMALIGYGNDRDSAEWMCGGSVITERFILSAAHCISSPALGEIKYAALGVYSRTQEQFSWEIYDIAKIIPYPDYRPPSKYHDIALLGTSARIRFHHQVMPACINRKDTLPKIATVTGWGAMGHRKPLADVLQTVAVYRYTDEECSEAYPKHRHLKDGFDPITQVCYGDEEHESDTCEGDSGGPLQVKAKDYDERTRCIYTIYGVTSYGKACGYVGSSGMYTRVSAYVPWIESVTGQRVP